ncbi:MAG: hypothetical protein EZS26_002862 [Candidatus Ordinivivax streblomastigis]|uniref:Uncharacterized protein n=1 Tax=Candidatus Ordinivivax streblomastigis TaxID=2540710 RepID=A0A5M8NWF9_9BACT|nr:MAG: hypothetical protein EZS26_002862 [Candidatus Ordinivivax streblomastigis]
MKGQLKKNIFNQFTAGILIGCLLTIGGAFLQVHLQQKYDKEKMQHELSKQLSNTMNGTLVLGVNFLSSVNNLELKPKRWDNYINEGYVEWSKYENIYKNHINHNYPELTENFEKLCKDFHNVYLTFISVPILMGH